MNSSPGKPIAQTPFNAPVFAFNVSITWQVMKQCLDKNAGLQKQPPKLRFNTWTIKSQVLKHRKVQMQRHNAGLYQREYYYTQLQNNPSRELMIQALLLMRSNHLSRVTQPERDRTEIQLRTALLFNCQMQPTIKIHLQWIYWYSASSGLVNSS